MKEIFYNGCFNLREQIRFQLKNFKLSWFEFLPKSDILKLSKLLYQVNDNGIRCKHVFFRWSAQCRDVTLRTKSILLVIPQRGNNLAQRYSFVSLYNGGSLGTENESNRIYKDGVVENTFQYFEFETWKKHFITFFPQSHKFREKGKDCDVMFWS